MKKIIVINALFLISYVQSADVNLQETLPPDIQLEIILLSKEGATFDEFITKLKDKRLVNTYWKQLFDDPTTINALLENASKQWNTSKSAIAYSLGTPGAQEWLKNNNISLEQIFTESTTKDHFNSDFLNSKYFNTLVAQVFPILIPRLLHFINQHQNLDELKNNYAALSGKYIEQIKKTPELLNAYRELAILLATSRYSNPQLSSFEFLKKQLGDKSFVIRIIILMSLRFLFPKQTALRSRVHSTIL